MQFLSQSPIAETCFLNLIHFALKDFRSQIWKSLAGKMAWWHCRINYKHMYNFDLMCLYTNRQKDRLANQGKEVRFLHPEFCPPIFCCLTLNFLTSNNWESLARNICRIFKSPLIKIFPSFSMNAFVPSIVASCATLLLECFFSTPLQPLLLLLL